MARERRNGRPDCAGKGGRTHYDENILELRRTAAEAHAGRICITCRYLERYIAAGAVIAEVGVGGGHYSEFLASRDCSLYLIDVSQGLLEVAAARLRAAGLGKRILDVRHGSATSLSHFPNACCDVVLLLGPLYHLCDLTGSRRAGERGCTGAKTGWLALCSRHQPLGLPSRCLSDATGAYHGAKGLLRGTCTRCNLDPQHAPPLGYATPEQQRRIPPLFSGTFAEIISQGSILYTHLARSPGRYDRGKAPLPGWTWSSRPARQPMASACRITSSTLAVSDKVPRPRLRAQVCRYIG